jgi:hypothetical protein
LNVEFLSFATTIVRTEYGNPHISRGSATHSHPDQPPKQYLEKISLVCCTQIWEGELQAESNYARLLLELSNSQEAFLEASRDRDRLRQQLEDTQRRSQDDILRLRSEAAMQKRELENTSAGLRRQISVRLQTLRLLQATWNQI